MPSRAVVARLLTSTPALLFVSLRPEQWTKNLFVFAGVLFGGRLLDASALTRAVAGAVAIAVPISHWLLICTTLLALFIALSKRRHELTLLAGGATGHRRILEEYSPYLVDQMIAVVTASTVVAYSVYAAESDTAQRLGTTRLPLTIPFVLYGIFRYLYLVHQLQQGGSPAELLVNDRPLLICVALWAASVAVLLYSPLGG